MTVKNRKDSANEMKEFKNTMKSIRNHNRNFPAARKINCWHFASATLLRDPV